MNVLRYQWYFTFTNYGLVTVTVPDDHEDLSYFLNSKTCLLTGATLVDTDYYSQFDIRDQIDGVLYSVLLDDCTLIKVTTKAVIDQGKDSLSILPGFEFKQIGSKEKKYCIATTSGVITSEDPHSEIELTQYLVA